MDVDMAKFQEHSPDEMEQLRKSKSCFFCKKKGHIAWDCCKRKATGGGGWSGVTGRSWGQGLTQKQTSGQKAHAMAMEDDEVTVVPDIKSLSREEMKEVLLGLPEDDHTEILDSVMDF
jgi:hypothetical protein